jgi:hypothetical protein
MGLGRALLRTTCWALVGTALVKATVLMQQKWAAPVVSVEESGLSLSLSFEEDSRKS